MKYLVIFLVLVGTCFSIANAQYLGDTEFYHLSLTVESEQYSILAQSIINHFTGVVYDKSGSLIFSTDSDDSIDTYTITMNKQTFLELLSTDFAKTPDSMLVLINGIEQPYKTIEDDEIISWRFYVPPPSNEVEIVPSTPRFSTGMYSLNDIPHGAPRIYPPLKQNHVGITAENIQCKENLVLIQKHDGSPACVKPNSVSKLVTREWGISDNWIKISNADKSIHYELENAKISYVLAFSELQKPSLPEESKETSLQIGLIQTQDGMLKITLPRTLIDSKINNLDDGFFVLLDGMETDYTETKTESKRTLEFSFTPENHFIEIIGYGYHNAELSPFDDRLSELYRQCNIDKPGSIWDESEKLCSYSTIVRVTGGHTIPSPEPPLISDFQTQYEIAKQIYKIGEPISFTETVQGYGNPCISSHYEILDENTLETVWRYKIVYPCPFIKDPQQFKTITTVPNDTIPAPILNQTGQYILRSHHSYSDGYEAVTFSVIDESVGEKENKNPNTLPPFPQIESLRPEDRLQVRHSAGYTTVEITLSSWEEYGKWEKSRGDEHDPMPPIPIDESNINPIVFDLLSEMWQFKDYEVSKYDKSLFVKTIQKDYGVQNHHGIKDWLKTEHGKSFGESNDGYSSHFEFRDKVYRVTMVAAD